MSISKIVNLMKSYTTYHIWKRYPDYLRNISGTIPDSVEDYAVYMCPTGATVEEISVFRTSDAAAVEEMIQTHLDARKTEYESYRPDEVKKLDGAAVVKSGDYVAVIIADDTAAAEAAFEAELGA